MFMIKLREVQVGGGSSVLKRLYIRVVQVKSENMRTMPGEGRTTYDHRPTAVDEFAGSHDSLPEHGQL
jgi:hypothetical protein